MWQTAGAICEKEIDLKGCLELINLNKWIKILRVIVRECVTVCEPILGTILVIH